ncbi:hypothetical protein CDL12_24329 [Handroanthus impetiginosus]|uniref:RING-type E3 ubiquitin transferase n=1 Tax=Handroanthus impetiginosus TaxID=429701 RepID=A0A2G9GCX9_9LAMI|nr:hypothetical protein CDL12_24329 [Handroanthus impetiginosus]
MGAVCCCFRVPDESNNTSTDNSCPNDCLCPKCFFQKLFNKSRNIFARRQTLAISSRSPQPSTSDSEVVFTSLSDATASHYDSRTNTASSRHVQQHNEASQRPEKGASSSRVQPEPIGQHDIRVNLKSIQKDKVVVSKQNIRSQKQNPESSEKVLSTGVDLGNLYTFPSLDEEDVCPTCLEEYTEENPKIIAECSHHFHLSCIYDWMERSVYCPVCRKLMLFKEAN